MTVWWQHVILFCCLLYFVDSRAPSRVLQVNKYKNSFRLTRSTRAHVQQLLKKYKEQHLGNMHFEDRSQQLKALPLLSTDFYSWLNLTDGERLQAAYRDMQIYCHMLDWKRNQMEKEERDNAARADRASLSQWIKHIQLDLRDLTSQVNSQMKHIGHSWVKGTGPTVRPPFNAKASSNTLWDSRVEGYIILRDLELYLTKLARDFLLLASKTHS